MLNQPTIEKLYTMKLHGMADAFRAQLETTDSSSLSFEERFAMLVDQQWNWRQNRALQRRLHNAKLRGQACAEDLDWRTPRGLDRALLRGLLTDSDWVRRRQNLFLLGREQCREQSDGE